MLFLIMSVVLVVSIIALRLPHIHFDVLITALATYGPASILFLYWFQTFFDKPAAAQLVTGLALVLGPFIVGGIILGVGLASEWTPTQMDHALKITFIFPSAAIFIPLVIQYLNEINNFKIDGTSFFWISIGLAFGHLGMVILTQILNSYGLFNRVFESAVLPINPPDSDVDSNVVQVNQYVRSKEWMQDPDATLVASGLRKVYKGFTAVNSVSFECKKGSVFALLGANGSGKSSCINMLTAEVKPSQSVQSQYDPTIEHTAYIDKFDVVKNPLDCYHNVGVCPQFDALSLELTGRQTLNFY
jgi:ABC-type multidrug transport system fused ATPase/permease subunit